MTRRHLLLDSPFPCCFSALVGDQLEGCPSSHIASSWPKLTISWDCQLSPRPTTCLTCCPSWCSCSPAPPAPALSFNWCSSSSKSAALLLTHVLRQVCCCCSVFAAAHCDQLLPFKYVVSRVWGRASCSTFQARQAGRRHVPARSTESSGSAIRIVKLDEPVGWRETRSFRGVVFLLTGTRHNPLQHVRTQMFGPRRATHSSSSSAPLLQILLCSPKFRLSCKKGAVVLSCWKRTTNL